MSTPRFVQLIPLEERRLAALDENGNVWLYAPWRPNGATEDFRPCWNRITDTMADAWPAPKPKLEECLVLPPTVEEEAEREVDALLKGSTT